MNARGTRNGPKRVLSAIGLPVVPAALLLSTFVAGAQQPADYFRQNCMSCHTIGGGQLTGPELKGVTERQNRE